MMMMIVINGTQAGRCSTELWIIPDSSDRSARFELRRFDGPAPHRYRQRPLVWSVSAPACDFEPRRISSPLVCKRREKSTFQRPKLVS
jgi:hypothetical protein